MKIQNFIGGEFRDPITGEWIDDVGPATGEVIAQIPDSGGDDVEEAVSAAKTAFPSWKSTSADERSRILLRVADRIERDADDLAAVESRDTGKPVALARRMDIARAIQNFRFFATAILHGSSEAHLTDGRALNYTLRQPIGVAGLISPWNLPLYLLTWKIAPAIAAGNTCVAKPSELTPLTADRLARILRDEGVPDGVVNIVHGSGARAGDRITAHPEVPMISFTGGTATGRKVARNAAEHFKKISLELGGKNPNLIFADADLDEAVTTTVQSSFSNQGEICLCGSRILVEKSIEREFTTRFVDRVSQLRVGLPEDPSTDVGALISLAHLEKVSRYVDSAREEGGRILTGGERISIGNGFFYSPTVISGLTNECTAVRDEIFGPVVTIQTFTTEEEAVDLANGTKYGLSASVWTQNLQRGHRVAARIDSGTVWVNTWLLRDLRVPFGGVKESGLGREGGIHSLEFFTEAKNVCIKL